MSCRLWIVWLMLALLPMRGWAVAAMAMPAGPASVASMASEGALNHGTSAALPPCHEATADNDSAGAVNACTLCDLCHCASAVSPQIVLPAAPLPDALPRPAMARDTGRHTAGGLERPPRSVLV